MKKVFGLAFALTTALATASLAAPQHERVRGTVSSISPTTLVVQPPTGADISVALTDKTHYLQVEKSSLSHIDPGSFIGTATKSVGSLMVALEVVIFPPSMAGTGEGHYAWDKLPDTTRAGAATTASSMTNGTVEAVKSGPATVNSSMTNGTVAASAAHDGAQELAVTYKGGQQTILVPPTAPIVIYRPGTMAEVTKGAAVFVNGVKDGDGVTANSVAVGVDGVRPPM